MVDFEPEEISDVESEVGSVTSEEEPETQWKSKSFKLKVKQKFRDDHDEDDWWRRRCYINI